MAKIYGNTVTTPMPVADWNQTDENKADYIKNKPTILTERDVVDIIVENGGVGGGGSVTPEQIQEAVDNYLEEHPVDGSNVDLSEYYTKKETDQKIKDRHLVVAIEVDGTSCNVRSGTFSQIEEAYRNGSVVSLEVYRKGYNKFFYTAEVAEIGPDYIEFKGGRLNTFDMYTWRTDNTVTLITISTYSTLEMDRLIGDIDSVLDAKVDADFVNTAINSAIGEALEGEY